MDFPHYNLTTRVIKEGDAIVIDFGCEYKRVRSDITRTIFIGKPTDKQREVYDLVRAANEAAEKVAVDGAWIPDIDAAAREIITVAGYGDKFTTRLGHGIGYLGMKLLISRKIMNVDLNLVWHLPLNQVYI